MDIIEDWKSNAKDNYNDFFDFLAQQHGSKDNIERVKSLHTKAFDEIDCLACANCCKTTPALITKKDAKRIAKHLRMPPKTFLRKYTIEDVTGEYITQTVPCVFLNTDYTCAIYEVRPEACKRFPHTDEEEFFKRTKLNANNTLVCPASYAVVRRLKSEIENI